jgi:hypothetical protein
MRLPCLLCLAWAALTLPAIRAQGIERTALLTLSATSLRVNPAVAQAAGQSVTQSFTTRFDGQINGELALSPEGAARGYETQLVLAGLPNRSEPLTLPALLDLPPTRDDDLNGLTDFYEVRRAVSGRTSVGEITFESGGQVFTGSLALTWARTAASVEGTVGVRVQVPGLSLDLAFEHRFEIFEYSGSLIYRRSSTNATARLTVRRDGGPGTLDGPFNLLRVDGESLTFRAGALTNESGRAIGYDSADNLGLYVVRGGLLTNYFGLVYFPTSTPLGSTTTEDDEFTLWELNILDPNDADGDGLSDLLDEPDSPSVGPLRLSIDLNSGAPELFVIGDVGRTYVVEAATNLVGRYTQIATGKISSAQPVQVGLPLNSPVRRFFRLRPQ